MKLFAVVPHREGSRPPINAYVTIGRCYDSWDYNSPNGFYIKIISPFARNQLYVCPDTFTMKQGPCRFVWRLMSRHLRNRVSGNKGERITSINSVRAPV